MTEKIATKSLFLDDEMAGIYERRFKKGVDHDYPNVNSVRTEAAFYREKRGGKILDYGFGYAQETAHFAKKGYKVWGLDVSQSAVDRGNERLKQLGLSATLSTVDASWDKLPYEDNFFDAIHSNQCIYFIADLEKQNALLKEFKRILKPDGKMYVSLAGPENSIRTTGKKIGENVYQYGAADGEPHKCYIYPDKPSIEKSFGIFDIAEIGSFNNVYCGVNGFHWVVLAKNKK